MAVYHHKQMKAQSDLTVTYVFLCNSMEMLTFIVYQKHTTA